MFLRIILSSPKILIESSFGISHQKEVAQVKQTSRDFCIRTNYYCIH